MTNGWEWKGQDNWYIYWAPTADLLTDKRRRLSAVATDFAAGTKSYDSFNMYGTGYKILVEQLQPTMVSGITAIFVASGVWNDTYENFLAASGVTP